MHGKTRSGMLGAGFFVSGAKAARFPRGTTSPTLNGVMERDIVVLDAVRKPPIPDVATERAVRAFLVHIAGRYPIREAILFGSRARGTHTAESDADLAVVLTGSVGDRRAAMRDMAGIAFDALLETGILVDALPLWEGELDRSVAFRNPALIEAIRHEGRRL